MSESTSIDVIRSKAVAFRSIVRDELGVDLGYDEQAVRWLDGFIQRQHESGDRAKRDGMIIALGSFLGECFIHSLGGHWAVLDGSWCVQIDDQNAVFPFAKVEKQLENGSEDSVLGFFTAIPLVIRRSGSTA